MGFEDDLHRLMEEKEVSRTALAKAIDASPAYISQLLNGAGGNFTLKTMAKLACALDALVQIRLVLDGNEVVRVMSIEEARHFDDRKERGVKVLEPASPSSTAPAPPPGQS
ncbi:MAG: helix-turn-helix domain-containing protein [Candidatus Rokuibacteriota bacterium]